MYSVNLVGTLPAEIGAWVDVTHVQLSMNQLSGSLPPEIGNWTKLRELYAYDNQLTGPIPVSVGGWAELTVFDVFGNQLSGPVPPSIARGWKRLQVFNVDRNRLSGPLPALPFDSIKQCDLLNHEHGGKNAFDCPWPANTTSHCRKNDDSQWVAVTDSDCV